LVFGSNIEDLLPFEEEFDNVGDEYIDEDDVVAICRRIEFLKRVTLFVLCGSYLGLLFGCLYNLVR
jgi:hypothetical protein